MNFMHRYMLVLLFIPALLIQNAQAVPPFVFSALKMINIAFDYGCDVAVVHNSGDNTDTYSNNLDKIKYWANIDVTNNLWNCDLHPNVTNPLADFVDNCACSTKQYSCVPGTVADTPHLKEKQDDFCLTTTGNFNCAHCVCSAHVFNIESPQSQYIHQLYTDMDKHVQEFSCDVDSLVRIGNTPETGKRDTFRDCYIAGIVFAVLGAIPVAIYMKYLGVSVFEQEDMMDEESDVSKWWMIVACHLIQDFPMSTILTALLVATVAPTGKLCLEEWVNEHDGLIPYDHGYSTLEVPKNPVVDGDFGFFDLLGTNVCYALSFTSLILNLLSSGMMIIKVAGRTHIGILIASPVLLFLWICFVIMPFFGIMYIEFKTYLDGDSTLMQNLLAFFIIGLFEWVVVMGIFCYFGYRYIIYSESPFDSLHEIPMAV